MWSDHGMCHSIFGQFSEKLRDATMHNMGAGFVVLSHHSLFDLRTSENCTTIKVN